MASDYQLPDTVLRIPEITYPLVLDTIGKQMALGVDITVHCQECGRASRLNLVALGDRLGVDYPAGHQALSRVLHCSVCRAAGRPDRRMNFTCKTAQLATTLPADYWQAKL